MVEEKKHSNVKALKIFLIGLTVFVGLQLLGRYLLTTDLVHRFVKSRIVSLANEQLTGKLSIEKVDGDLWEEIQLTKISVIESDTIFTADTLYVNYNIWSFLKSTYVINEFELIGVFSDIEEQQDSMFNIQQLVKEDSKPDEETDPLNVVISQINFRDINTRIISPSYLPDSVLTIRNLNANASFSKTDTLQFSLSGLSFLLEEGRLPEPIRVKTSANVLDNQISLQEIVIESGRSILKASASSNLADSTFDANAQTTPFSLADINPYLDTKIPEDELEMSIEVFGSFDEINLKVNVSGAFANSLEIVAAVNLNGEPSVTEFGVLGEDIDFAYLTNDSLRLQLGNARITLSGTLEKDMPSSDVIWGFTFHNIIYEQYVINRLIGSGTYTNDFLTGHIGVNPQLKEQLNATTTIKGMLSEAPDWRVDLNLDYFDASGWGLGSDLETNLSLVGFAEGSGFGLSGKPINYELKGYPNNSFLDKRTVINGQIFNGYELKGIIQRDSLSSEGYVAFSESRINFEAHISDYQMELPRYEYLLTTKGFNLQEINQLSDFPTHLNMLIKGEGVGIEAENSTFSSVIQIDSSIVNGAQFQKLDAVAVYENGVLNITQGLLNSDIIEGQFTGRKNVIDETDPENWLSLDMKLKDIQPLAPLANVEVLNASGDITGRITQDTAGVLRGNMSVNLRDIIVDSLLTASGINGRTELILKELPGFSLNLGIESPVISGITFQDIQLVSNGIMNEDTLRSHFNLEIVGSDRGKLIQDGLVVVDVSEELTDIGFSSFNFITNESELTMNRPFNVRFKGTSVGTDTLDLTSTTGAFLKFSIPYADSLEQYGWINGQNFDFGIIQEVIFGERFLDGVLSGELFFNRSEEQTSGNGAFNLTRLKYGDIEADSMDLRFDIFNERLKAAASLSWDDQERVKGNLDVPFVLKEQSELDDEFYKQPIEGGLIINPSELTRFKAFLRNYGVENTDGILSFDGSMSGTAGEPNFEGRFTLNQPVLSGIRVDTVKAGFNYDNNNSGLKVETEIIAANQKAAQIFINYPLEYDFRNFQVILPDEEEVIKVNARTDNFNLAVFNDFLNKEYMRGVTGTLNADLRLEGTSGNLVPGGFLRLTGGKVSIPVAGITLEGVRSDIEFTQKGLSVKELVARSGRGSFSANGTVAMQGIIPKTLDLNAKATQFRLANTNDYNLVIDLNGKLAGEALTPKATGKITVRNGFVYLENFGEDPIEAVQLEGEELSSFSPYDSLAMEMVVEIQDNFFVRNQGYLDMEIEMVGELDAVKETGKELALFGSLDGTSGYVRPLGKLFNIEEAGFIFSGPVDDPEISIRSRYIPPTRQKGESVELFYIIEGYYQTLSPEDFRFESDPQMEQSDIICYTLFNKPCYSLESWQSVFASGGGPSATDILTDVLLDEVEALATRELGVDVVQIDNSGASGGTSIKTGWYLNERTFFAIINEISGSTPKTLFMLEYILSERWDLIMTQGDDSRRGVDFRFQYDY